MTTTLEPVRGADESAPPLEGGPWDGKTFSYIPPAALRIDPSLVLDDVASDDVDPITYQVLRSRFWHINIEHGDTIKKVSGSPVIVWGDDFNTCILTESGDTVVSGPSVQYFTGCADLITKWTLEYRSTNPGIEDGDIFLQNDPFIGAPHQLDASTYAPVFWGGKLFCWVFSQCHVGDIGGVDPGSFCVNARDIFDDPLPFPPIKLVRRGELQADVADVFTRQSRMPAMIALQLRSQIAGINDTRQRLLETIERYGPEVVKGVMRRMIRDCSAAVSARLSALPDGEWTEAVYTAGVGPADRSVHREATTIRKVGDRLICSNAGTDPQSMAGNSTFSSWRSAAISAASAMFASDQMYCPAGVVEHMDFRPTPGTRNVATFPAAISALTSTLVSVNLVYLAMSKMLLSGPPEVRAAANAAGGFSTPGWWVAFGLDRFGQFVADTTADAVFGAIGGFADHDGIDTGGAWWFPRTVAANAEEWETALPILYLYRKEKKGSGGAGRHRGGNGAEIAIMGHKTSDLNIQVCSTDPAVNATRGLAGGLPGHSGNHRYIKGSKIAEVLGSGILPGSAQELSETAGQYQRVGPKSFLRLLPDDVFIVGYCGGGGVGDPLDREPNAVLTDVHLGAIDTDRARVQWGVVLNADGIDESATLALRAALRSERMKGAPVDARRAANSGSALRQRSADAPRHPMSLNLECVDESDGRWWACQSCGGLLAPAKENFKSGTLFIDRELHDVDAEVYPRVADFCDDDVILRSYFCPGCGSQLSVDVCRREDDHLWDLKLTDA